MNSVPIFPVTKISAKHAPTEIFILGKIGTELIALLALLLQYCWLCKKDYAHIITQDCAIFFIYRINLSLFTELHSSVVA